jgi:hypothetical protein
MVREPIGQVFAGSDGHVVLRVRRVGAEPQGGVGGLHRLSNHPQHLVAQGVEVRFLAQPGVESGERLGGVVLPPVEAAIHQCLHHTVQRVEQRRYGQG